MLEDEGFFTEADIVIQPSGDGMDSEEDRGGEEYNDANHLSCNQILAEANVRIEYGDRSNFNTLEEDEIENKEMNNDSTDESTDFTMQQTKVLVEKNNKSNLSPSKIDNDKVMEWNLTKKNGRKTTDFTL